MPDPKTDRSAMGLLRRVFKVTQWGDVDALEEELPAAELHARNVDKQRRRLLADSLLLRAVSLEDHALWCWRQARTALDEAESNELKRVAGSDKRRASKLRTVAARLRDSA